MQRAPLCFAVVFPWVCLASPTNLSADDADSHMKRASDWNVKDKFDKAIEDYSRALQINPGFALAYWFRDDA